ncbi:DUF6580 family putative transport protein [Phaeocystidibacter marisrubri]|uniref:ECF transporter S component n=1 Tax=Phaeocystidibacter marisrubri TaxID=1577780 RepID=A0A6L3ZIN0_9FLAO|nr:DUF6580 family putative transport protein [Phaeocystidibacter marisrubri]KAB2817687.1 hypothetical protein F8C82_04595 [Phaeocystidibacter marisrubri]GGH74093.1 hypothetical protein GCM10011318_19720 [Phaeocystidibacter marisrubri]
MNRRQTFTFVASLLAVAAFTRLIPHAPNFTSMGAVALIGGAWFRKSSWSVLLPLLALFASDLVLNNLVYSTGSGFTLFYSGAEYIYGAFALISLLGAFGLKNAKLSKFGRYAIFGGVSAFLFFLISNFGVWMADAGMYSKDFAGLMACYTAAVPYALNSVASFIAYGFAIMGIKEVVEARFAASRA